jgi:hypothetical protein
MIFHTTSRPALRAAASGGRPRPATPTDAGHQKIAEAFAAVLAGADAQAAA